MRGQSWQLCGQARRGDSVCTRNSSKRFILRRVDYWNNGLNHSIWTILVYRVLRFQTKKTRTFPNFERKSVGVSRLSFIPLNLPQNLHQTLVNSDNLCQYQILSTKLFVSLIKSYHLQNYYHYILHAYAFQYINLWWASSLWEKNGFLQSPT